MVRVPRTPRRAFNKQRKPSRLLLDQIRHLEWAVLPASQRTPGRLPKTRVKTEEQAAERIAQLTTMLLDASAKKAAATAPESPAGQAPLPPVKLPPLPRATHARRPPTAKKARPARSKRGRR
jgi:hypothetical protein